jgi:hypothetical protein
MATPYSDVINVFLGKVNDYDLPNFTDTQREEIVTGYLLSACRKFYKICLIDLTDRDDVAKQFNETLDDEVTDIVSELMMVEWLKPKVLSSENLKNCLSTKDYSMFSPANLLNSIRETYELCKKDAKSLINNYSFEHADFNELGGN